MRAILSLSTMLNVPTVLPFALAMVATTLLTACASQHDCQSSCVKLFGEQAEQCNIQVPGHTGDEGRQEMIDMCEDHCEGAMGQAGEAGDYSPNERTSGNEDVGLANDAQAALWMDCVAESACTDLKENYCAPTTNFPGN